MSPSKTTRRAAAAMGSAALIGLAFAAPALASSEGEAHAVVQRLAGVGGSPSLPNPGPPSYNSWPNLSMATPNPGPPSYNSWPNYTPTHESRTANLVPSLDRTNVQYVQIGLGAVGGAALAAAGALVTTRQRRHRAAHA